MQIIHTRSEERKTTTKNLGTQQKALCNQEGLVYRFFMLLTDYHQCFYLQVLFYLLNTNSNNTIYNNINNIKISHVSLNATQQPRAKKCLVVVDIGKGITYDEASLLEMELRLEAL